MAALGEDAHPHVHRRGSEVKRNLSDKILVGGGHLPGCARDNNILSLSNGYRPSTIKGYVKILKYLSKMCYLLNPVQVKSIIADQEWLRLERGVRYTFIDNW